jgi:hypothetical protein
VAIDSAMVDLAAGTPLSVGATLRRRYDRHQHVIGRSYALPHPAVICSGEHVGNDPPGWTTGSALPCGVSGSGLLAGKRQGLRLGARLHVPRDAYVPGPAFLMPERDVASGGRATDCPDRLQHLCRCFCLGAGWHTGVCMTADGVRPLPRANRIQWIERVSVYTWQPQRLRAEPKSMDLNDLANGWADCRLRHRCRNADQIAHVSRLHAACDRVKGVPDLGADCRRDNVERFVTRDALFDAASDRPGARLRSAIALHGDCLRCVMGRHRC